MTVDEAVLHLRYSTWASRKLVEAVKALPAEDREQATGVSHNSLLGTLGHIMYADWIWHTRVIGPFEKPEGTMEALATIWPEIQRRWEAWAESQTEADLARELSFKFTDGSAGQTPAWQIVMHVVNHATLHRGQAMAMLRQRGIAPPPTDLIYYYRELRAAGAGG